MTTLRNFFRYTGYGEEILGYTSILTNGVKAAWHSFREYESPTDLETVIARDVIKYLGLGKNHRPVNKYCAIMRRTVKEILGRYRELFGSITHHLHLTNNYNAMITFTTICDEIFYDNMICWGRVVAVYALGVDIVKCLPNCDKGMEIAIGKYVADKLSPWIDKNGGWDAFYYIFSRNNYINAISAYIYIMTNFPLHVLRMLKRNLIDPEISLNHPRTTERILLCGISIWTAYNIWYHRR